MLGLPQLMLLQFIRRL